MGRPRSRLARLTVPGANCLPLVTYFAIILIMSTWQPCSAKVGFKARFKRRICMFLSQVRGLGSWKRDHRLVLPINTVQHLAVRPLTLLKESRERPGGHARLRMDASLLSVSVLRWT